MPASMESRLTDCLGSGFNKVRQLTTVTGRRAEPKIYFTTGTNDYLRLCFPKFLSGCLHMWSHVTQMVHPGIPPSMWIPGLALKVGPWVQTPPGMVKEAAGRASLWVMDAGTCTHRNGTWTFGNENAAKLRVTPAFFFDGGSWTRQHVQGSMNGKKAKR